MSAIQSKNPYKIRVFCNLGGHRGVIKLNLIGDILQGFDVCVGLVGGHFKAAMTNDFLLICVRRFYLLHHCGEGMTAAMRRIQVGAVRFQHIDIQGLQRRIEGVAAELLF